MGEVSGAGIVDGVHRGARLVTNKARAARVRARAMGSDWSWDEPAKRYASLYDGLVPTSEPVVEKAVEKP